MFAPVQDPTLELDQVVHSDEELDSSVLAVLDPLGFVPLPFLDERRSEGVEADPHLVQLVSTEDAEAVLHVLLQREIMLGNIVK